MNINTPNADTPAPRDAGGDHELSVSEKLQSVRDRLFTDCVSAFRSRNSERFDDRIGLLFHLEHGVHRLRADRGLWDTFREQTRQQVIKHIRDLWQDEADHRA